MELRPGYKQTEVAVIPEEWGVEALGNIFDFSGGHSASWDQLTTAGYCYLHYGDIHGSTKTFIDVQADYLDIPKLNIPLERVNQGSILADGDVVFVDASEDDEGTSRHIVVVNDTAIPYISGLHTIVAKSKTQALDNGYKRYCFQSHDIKRQFLFYAVGTKVSGINKTNIKKIFIPVPPLPEQRAIAGALGDVDALLAALERVIAKKRDLKKATMQQLLTGQTRLPGFSGEWEVKRLGEIAFLYQPETISAKQFTESGYPVYGANGVVGFYREFNHDNWQVTVTCRGSTCGTVNRTVDQCWITGNAMVVNCDHREDVDKNFLYYLLLSQDLSICITGTGQPQIVRRPLADFSINFPANKIEQTAIAAVLSDMDDELAALEARLSKTRDLKHGMMQELLTGRTRLI